MKKNSKMLFAGIGTVMMLMTLFAIIGVASAVWSWSSSDVAGDFQDSFCTNEIVYAMGDLGGASESGLAAISARIYVTQNRNWPDGCYPITDIIAQRDFQTMGGAGTFIEVAWGPPLIPGDYDIVLDEDQDGVYNSSYDAVDGATDVGFTVLGPTPTQIDYNDNGQIIGDWDDVRMTYECYAGLGTGCKDVNGDGKIAGDWGDVYTIFCGYAGFGGVI